VDFWSFSFVFGWAFDPFEWGGGWLSFDVEVWNVF
jgi:hypothetical protein